MNRRWPVGVFICCGIVVLASFMPWGSFSASPQMPFSPNPFGSPDPFGGANPLAGAKFNFTVTAWNGTFNLLGIAVPNWIPVVFAVLIALFAWLRIAQVWTAHPAASLALAGYGALHSGVVMFVLMSNGSVGLGSLATFAAFVSILALLSLDTAHVRTGESADHQSNS